MRILRAAGVLFVLSAFIACAGKPEILPEESSADLNEAPGDEIPPANETDEIPTDNLPSDNPSSPTEIDPETIGKGVVPSDRKKNDHKPFSPRNPAPEPDSAPAVESSGEGGDPLPSADPLSAGPAGSAEISEIEKAEPATVFPPVPAPVSQPPISPAATPAPAPPVNPLLSGGRPVDSFSESESATESVLSTAPETETDSAPAAAPEPAQSPPPETLRPRAVSPADSAMAELLSEPLDDPAVSASSPSRVLDEPGEFTVTLEGLGWVFRSDLSTPGSWRFLERNPDGNSTHFRFMFTETGNWNLVFQRQDLSSGGSESAVRNVVVMDENGGAQVNNGPPPAISENPVPGNMPSDAESRYDAAVAAVSRGDIGEALEFWEQDASRDDEAGRKARAALVENAADTGAIGPLVTWIPRYLDENPDPETLAAALDTFEGLAGYDPESLGILEKLAERDFGSRRPEWLYRLASYLEKPGPERNLDRAAYLYQEVITDWPLTDWRDLSEERLLWLQRHYFRVR